MPMNWDVTEVKVQGDAALWVRFHDGLEGMVTFSPSAFRGVLAHLSQPAEFRQARVQDGVLTWPPTRFTMPLQPMASGRWIKWPFPS